MYEIQVRIKGTAPLLQNRFTPDALNNLMQGAKKKTGVIDYSAEWLKGMYASSEGYLFQPATHLEGALVEAAKAFKIKGSGNKTWKSVIRAYCYVKPDEIIHLRDGKPVTVPDASLEGNPTEYLKVNIQRVKVRSAAVARSRLEIAEGWQLNFTIEVIDDQVRPVIVQEILSEAGCAVGIGDYRPRYGRFDIIQFEVQSKED